MFAGLHSWLRISRWALDSLPNMGNHGALTLVGRSCSLKAMPDRLKRVSRLFNQCFLQLRDLRFLEPWSRYTTESVRERHVASDCPTCDVD